MDRPLKIGAATVRCLREDGVEVPIIGGLLKPAPLVEQERRTGKQDVIGPDFKPKPEHEAMAADILGVDWLRPNYVNKDGALVLNFQMFVIDAAGKRIVVDTCLGDHKDREATGVPLAHMRQGDFIGKVRAGGIPPESVDFVLCTHLHWDHVGWNTSFVGGRWVPTFPKARYLFGKKEYKHFSELCTQPDKVLDQTLMRDSIGPIVSAGLHTLVDSDHVIASDGQTSVSLRPTEGHTPGHVSVVISSGGRQALITGDCIHHPAQIAFPGVSSYFDHHSPAAADTRHSLLRDLQESGSVLIGTHFAQPCAGTLAPDRAPGRGYRFLPTDPGSRL